MRLMGKPLPMAGDFLRLSKKETGVTCKGGRAMLVLLHRWPEPLSRSEREGERGRESGRGKGLVVFDFERKR